MVLDDHLLGRRLWVDGPHNLEQEVKGTTTSHQML
jgi:hypothetical protein